MVPVARVGQRTITVGIAEAAVSDDGGATIITHALGSCVAVVLWDPTLRVGGLLHYLLPSARGARPGERPDAAFADTGVPQLFESMYRMGCKKENLEVTVVGGASMGPKPTTDMFDIGARNVTALRKILFRNSVLIKAEEVGGSISRTVSLDVATGKVLVRSPKGEYQLGVPAPPAAPPPPPRPRGPRTVTVAAGELSVVDDPEVTFISPPLGSSLAVLAWDPLVRVGGMLVVQLPTSNGARQGERPPSAFADTGVPLLLESLAHKGARRETTQVWAVGGGSMSAPQAGALFDVGARNVTALRKLLFRSSLLLKGEDVGGAVSRTVSLEVASGRVIVRTPNGEKIL